MGMINIKVITPVFNAEKWVDKCIRSITGQSYPNWECIIINDNSTDRTFDVIKQVIPKQFYKNFKVINNTVNVGALKNIADGIARISHDPEDVILLLDGDDWLSHEHVFTTINKYYTTDSNLWMTHGQYVTASDGRIGCNRPLESTQEYRKQNWRTSHLRTFKNHIWNKINPNDLKNSSGDYYAMSWDLAIMYPLIEMCGLKRIKCIEEVLYVYNNLNPLNDYKKNISLQERIEAEIRNKSVYKEL